MAIDMWEAFENSIREHVPDAQSKVVFDRFHMMKHMKDAVDQVRKAEHKDSRPWATSD